MNIAIYNGNLKPTTFVLRLAQVVNKNHNLCVVGASTKLFKYKHADISFLPTNHNNKLILLFQLLFQLITFLVLYPKIWLHFVSILRKSDKPILTRIKQFLIWSKLIRNKADIVHIQWVSHLILFEELLDLSYFKIAVSLRGRLINSAPLSDLNLTALYRKTFPKIDKFHAVSNDIKKKAMHYGADENKIKVIYSGINVSSFKFNKSIKDSEPDTLNVLSIGREHWIKGYNYALEAIKGLKDKGVKINYTIIGASDSEELVVLRQSLNIEKEVQLLSRVSFEDVLNAMKQADVFLLPSVSEGLANVVIEAMLTGLPVISSDTGGMPELVLHNDTGLLFKNRDVTSLIDTVLKFKKLSIKEKETMIIKAYEKVNEQHNLKQFELCFNDFYASDEHNTIMN